MKTIERLYQYFEYKGIKPTTFEKETGISNGYFGKMKSRVSNIGSDIIERVIENSPDLNIEWLVVGKGKMLRGEQLPGEQEEKASAISEIEVSKGKYPRIPLVSVGAVAGFGNSEFSINEMDVKDYYIVPKFKDKRVDFMIELTGSSMYPKYSSGDVVACTILRESKFIQWNKVHVIGTAEQGILIKRVKKGQDDNHLMLISDNKDYDPFTISTEEITGMALVIGVIRLE